MQLKLTPQGQRLYNASGAFMTQFILTMLLVSVVLFFAEHPVRPKHGGRKN
jgi:hypothetical protein